MSYESRLEGTLAIDPPPSPDLVAELRAALEALADPQGRSGDPSSTWRLTPLGGGLVNEEGFDWEAQIEWLESLGGFGEAAAPALDTAIGCLRDEDPFVRYWATFALGRMGSRAAPALGRLEELTRDAADGPRYGALDAIRRIRS